MTTYDPAYKFLNCQCLVCDAPLKEAISVTVGIGPVCRRKHGYNAGIKGLEPATQRKANALIHEATWLRVKGGSPVRILAIATELEGLGLTKLADRIRDRFVKIRLKVADIERMRWNGRLRVEEPTGETIKVFQLFAPYDGRLKGKLFDYCKTYRAPAREKGKFSHWNVAYSDARGLYRVLAELWPGEMGFGPRGEFTICTAAEWAAKHSPEARTRAAS